MQLGRKVFFLYPHSVVQDELMLSLVKQEYEVFALKDHRTVSGILHRFPDALLFINVDDVLSPGEWESFIRKIQEDPQLSTVGIGALSYEKNDELKKKFLLEMGITCGFIQLKLGLQESLDILSRTLDANEAKGRRRYVRVNCHYDENISVNFRIEGNVISGRVYDISSVGFACSLDQKIILSKNTKVDVQLLLRGIIINTSGVIAGVRQDNKEVKIVLFYPQLKEVNRNKIHLFILRALQRSLGPAS